ncbi:MAG: tripartite tricarboxylate transporter TctB family protein [Sphaerochaetaceae bacterium]|nr:tripartite tricarboxylate transporter TctB family protein [Bacteroidales bacterium]
MRKANFISGIIGMVFSAVAFGYTFTFKQFINVPVGPEFFPRFLALGLFICSLILVLTNITDTPHNAGPTKTLSLRDKGMQRLVIGIGIVLAYALLWNVLGFLIITPFCLFGLMYLVDTREYRTMIVVSVVATALIFLVFKFLLGIEMPMGFMDW